MANFNTNKEIEIGIYNVMKIFNIERMPTSKEVRTSKLSGLEDAIYRTGGYVSWAEKLNLSPKKHTKSWKENEIEDEILRITSMLNLNRMPSKSEIEQVTNDRSILNAIARSYGFYGWSKRLSLPIKDCETEFGIDYQEVAIKMLQEKGYIATRTSVKAPYDIIINNKIRVDVKSGCAYELKGSRCHTFNLEKKFPTCDIYIIFASFPRNILY
jgi:hypothetical protein